MAYSLKEPHPLHVPDLGRIRTGTAGSGSAIYATSLSCSCGWAPDVDGHPRGWVTEAAPAQGGKTAASFLYRRHLLALGAVGAIEPQAAHP